MRFKCPTAEVTHVCPERRPIDVMDDTLLDSPESLPELYGSALEAVPVRDEPASSAAPALQLEPLGVASESVHPPLLV